MRSLTINAVGFGLTLLLPQLALAADDTCYSDWSVAAPIVRQENLMTVEQLSAAARSKLNGDIVKTTLCKVNGNYVFRLVVRSASGQLSSMTVDAKDPFRDP